MTIQLWRTCLKLSMSRAAARTTIIRQNLSTAAGGTVPPEEDVIIQKIDDKGILTLNRPKVLNALSLSQIRKMTTCLKKWQSEKSTSFVIIKAAGGKAFCCGGDLREITDAGKALNQTSRDYFFEEYTLDYLTSSLGFPWIAFIDGIVMGAGCGLSVHGQYRIATEKTLFAMPEMAIGLFTDIGGGYFLPRLRGKLGVYLALTGARLKGRDVQTAGIATHFVPSAELASLEKDLLSLRSAKPADVDAVIQTYHDKCSLDRNKPFALESQMEKIDSLFAATTLEGIFANLRQEGSEWSRQQLDILNKMSPTSMKVTFRLLNEGAKLTLAQDLKTEFRLSQRFIRDKDFYEGVRAVVVDKDQNPRWNPSRIEDVTQEKVDWYFSPLPEGERELTL